MLCIKFHQNRTINEEFDFWGVEGVVLGRFGGCNHFPPGCFDMYIFLPTIWWSFVLLKKNTQILQLPAPLIIGDPISRCTLQSFRSFWGAPSPSTNIYKYAAVLLTLNSLNQTNKINVLIIIMFFFSDWGTP